jgi:cytochrome c551/c552
MNGLSSSVSATIPALIVLGFFVWFANWIPQTRWQPPEKQEISSGMTPRQMSKVGKTIVRQSGCLTCHTIEPGVGIKGEGRGPNLANIAQRRAKGVPAGAGTLVTYLAESLYEPGAFLVEGYANIMPAAHRPPAKLGYEEVVAVIAYLQSQGGTPSIQLGDIPDPTQTPAAASVLAITATGDRTTLLDQFGCLGCHSRTPGEILVGPPFVAALLRQAAAERGMSAEAYVMEAIVNPQAVERGDFLKATMPTDYGERLTAGQLTALVTYLLTGEEGP